MEHFYFAYGSNISSARLKERCPSAIKITLAFLEDHVLCFPQHNLKDHLVAGLTYSKGNKLWGIVYSISEEDLSDLHAAEGYVEHRDLSKNSYIKTKKIILLNQNSGPITEEVFTFIQNKGTSQPPDGKPHEKSYLKFIIDGYEEFGISKLSENAYKEILKLYYS